MRFVVSAALTAVLGACASGPGHDPAPAPDPNPPAEARVPPPPPAPPPPPPLSNGTQMLVCVLRNGALAEVPVDYDSQTGDTLVNGRPFSQAYPVVSPPYAAASAWFVRNELLVMGGRRYPKYGLPREIQIDLLERVGEFQGIPVFVEAGVTGRPDVYYVPVRTGCVFQPYQIDYITGGVRGG